MLLVFAWYCYGIFAPFPKLTLEEKVQALSFLSHEVLDERSSFYVTMSLEYRLKEFLGLSNNFSLRRKHFSNEYTLTIFEF